MIGNFENGQLANENRRCSILLHSLVPGRMAHRNIYLEFVGQFLQLNLP
jgi:hypothetical protein